MQLKNRTKIKKRLTSMRPNKTGHRCKAAEQASVRPSKAGALKMTEEVERMQPEGFSAWLP
jgi:hypothetical protein